MKTTMAFTKGFLFMMAAILLAIGLFAAANAFATNGHVKSQGEVETVTEVSGDGRPAEIAAPYSSLGCIVNSMVSGDQRRPASRIASSEGSHTLTPVKTDECAETEYTMPMNR